MGAPMVRIEVTDDTTELTKMYWERARVLRRKGDIDGALVCLRDVTLLKADHVAALALLGEIRINRGEFAEAAPVFARLATLTEAPDQQRRGSGGAGGGGSGPAAGGQWPPKPIRRAIPGSTRL